MFDVVSCPKCSGRVTLPEGAPQHGWVRCPICRAEYQAHHLLEFHPPELELIDEPARPFEGRPPSWGAVAAAGAAGSAPNASEIAAPAPESIRLAETDELAVAPMDIESTPTAGDGDDDDSNVFTFDDSLLLDEPTGKLPYAQIIQSMEGVAQGAGDDMSEVGFPAGDSTDRQDDNTHETQEPPPLAGAAQGKGDEIRGTETHWSATTVLDRGGAAPVTSMPQIGLAPRRKSRRSNPALWVLKIFGGGILGTVIGYGILMWLPIDPAKRDPLRIAPKLPAFMVPNALRASVEERVARYSSDDKSADDAAARDGAKTDQVDQQSPQPQPFGDPDSDSGRSSVEPPPTPEIQPLDPTINQSKATPGRAIELEKDLLADPFGDSSATNTPTDTGQPVINPFDTAATNEESDPQPSKSQSAADPTEKLPVSPADSLGPVSDKRFTYQDVLSTVAAAKLTTQRALDLPLDAPAAQKKKINGPFYMNLCKIAEAVTFIERSAESELDDKATTAAIEAILNAVPDRHRLEELGKLAGYWYDRPQGNGIVLAGMVKESSPRGKLVESIVEPLGTSSPRPITVVSPSALTDDPGRPVLVAGTIVKDAVNNLRGYEGTADTVVWAAMAMDPSERSK